MFSDTLAGAPPAPVTDPQPPSFTPPPQGRKSRKLLGTIVAGVAMAVLAISVFALVGDDGSPASSTDGFTEGPAVNGPCPAGREGARTVTHDPVLVCTKTADGLRWLTSSAALSEEAKGRSVTGTFVLTDGDSLNFGGNCAGTGGYSDISSDTQVVIKDGAGKVLGVSSLGTGTASGKDCTFNWIIDELPKADFYIVEAGRRGSLTFSRSELEARGWHVASSLGS
jgi:hypothetical protein